jgi:hypothetical protein
VIPLFFAISWSQFATLKQGQNIKYLPYVFTGHGVAMLSSVLNSERAIQVNILLKKKGRLDSAFMNDSQKRLNFVLNSSIMLA